MPIQTNREWRRNVARMRQLDRMARRIRRLEERLGVGPNDDNEASNSRERE